MIEDICTNEKYSFTGGPFGSNLKVSDYTQFGVRVIQLNNINDIYFNDDNKVFVSVKKADSLKSCNAYSGDLIFAKMMPAGRLCILPKTYDRYLLGSDAIRLKPNIDKYYCFFLLECLNRTIIRNSITSKTSGSTRQRIGLLDLKKTSFYCPNYIEQKQIGLFFELIESKITNISKKINILKKYKKGIKKYVMKDTIKFWKTGIGNAIELKNYLIEKNEYCVKNGLYPHITLSTEGITDKSERYDRDFLVKNEDKKYKITHLNQLCYNPANLKFGVICINKYGNGIFSPIYSTFDINNIVIDYLELIITSNDFINYSMKYQQGTVFERMAVSSDDLCKIKIVTTSFDEQQKIAKVADTLNKKISKLEDELLSLKHLKSTLLNDMFI